MKLILIYGPPGVGKLSVAKELKQLTGFPVLHNHLVADLIWSIFNAYGAAHTKDLNSRIKMDVFEHAFMLDYGLNRADYIKAFIDAVDWDVVQKRFEKVQH